MLRLTGLVMAAGLVAALAAGCGTESGAKGSGAAQPIAWQACPDQMGAAVQCADIEVPLDWREPEGEKITVGIGRLPAADPARRIGSLIFDPGGPGGSGVGMIAGEAAYPGLFPAELRARFDLIGFDPRGIGTSKPAMRCDPELANRRPDVFVADQAAFDALVESNKAFGESCRRLTGPLLDHMDTLAVARDLDVVRQRLGGEPLNYVGVSYGTEIGLEYARLFPNGSRALVLDGALVHSLPPSAMHVYETTAFENGLGRFADWCRESADCALRGDDAIAVVRDLVARTRQAPLPAPACATSKQCAPQVRTGDLLAGVQASLLFKSAVGPVAGWSGLATALDHARAGDASDLSPHVLTDTKTAGLGVACAEYRTDFTTYAALKTQQILAAAIAPTTLGGTESYSYLAHCLGWPAEFTNPPHTVTAEPTITPLIVNSTHDPSTPYGWAQLMSTQIPNAVLLTREGDGHTSFFVHGRTGDAIVEYLIDGTVPAPGTVLTD